jgi:hypothetical protein
MGDKTVEEEIAIYSIIPWSLYKKTGKMARIHSKPEDPHLTKRIERLESGALSA